MNVVLGFGFFGCGFYRFDSVRFCSFGCLWIRGFWVQIHVGAQLIAPLVCVRQTLHKPIQFLNLNQLPTFQNIKQPSQNIGFGCASAAFLKHLDEVFVGQCFEYAVGCDAVFYVGLFGK